MGFFLLTVQRNPYTIMCTQCTHHPTNRFTFLLETLSDSWWFNNGMQLQSNHSVCCFFVGWNPESLLTSVINLPRCDQVRSPFFGHEAFQHQSPDGPTSHGHVQPKKFIQPNSCGAQLFSNFPFCQPKNAKEFRATATYQKADVSYFALLPHVPIPWPKKLEPWGCRRRHRLEKAMV